MTEAAPSDSAAQASVAEPVEEGRRGGRLLQYTGFLPSLVLFGIFLGAPLVLVVLYSLWRVKDYNVIHQWNLDNYRYLLGTGIYVDVAVRTLVITIATTTVTLLAAFPFVYWLCRYVPARLKRPLLVVVILPFATSYLLRVYAWVAILGDRGLVNKALNWLGLADQPVRLLYNSAAVVVVLVYLYLPFAVLTLFTAMERFNWEQLKAAEDLGARPAKAILRVLLPQMRSGLVTSVIFVFIPVLGEYLTPQLIGGTNGSMIGNTVVNFFANSQYARGAALGILIMAAVVVLLVPTRRHLDVGSLPHG